MFGDTGSKLDTGCEIASTGGKGCTTATGNLSLLFWHEGAVVFVDVLVAVIGAAAGFFGCKHNHIHNYQICTIHVFTLVICITWNHKTYKFIYKIFETHQPQRDGRNACPEISQGTMQIITFYKSLLNKLKRCTVFYQNII